MTTKSSSGVADGSNGKRTKIPQRDSGRGRSDEESLSQAGDNDIELIEDDVSEFFDEGDSAPSDRRLDPLRH